MQYMQNALEHVNECKYDKATMQLILYHGVLDMWQKQTKDILFWMTRIRSAVHWWRKRKQGPELRLCTACTPPQIHALSSFHSRSTIRSEWWPLAERSFQWQRGCLYSSLRQKHSQTWWLMIWAWKTWKIDLQALNPSR